MRALLALALTVSLPVVAQPVVAVDAFGFDLFAPVELVVAPGQPDRAYVVEQGVSGPARVQTFVPGDAAPTTFLDLTSRVVSNGERGLLGLAFHPDYAENGRVFVSYTAANPNRSVVSEFARAEGDALSADAASERVVLEVPQPATNHNGGQITFGPDGYLYLGLGDGGGANDEYGNGQNLETLLGAILRLDVDDVPEGEDYGIPASNPFAQTGSTARDEIYAYGLRNPWRFAFDDSTGDLWVMDVGQGEWEEIDRVEAGGNYGWPIVEGPECFQSGCRAEDFDSPVFSYSHSGDTGGFSISGGMVYRGEALPGLQGRVLYADYVSRRVWALDVSGSAPDTTLLLTLPVGNDISAVREGPDGEAYVLVHSFGGPRRTLRLDAVGVAAEPEPAEAPVLSLDGPNPFLEGTGVTVTAHDGGPVRLTLHDALGREVAVLLEADLAPGASRSVRVAGVGLSPGAYALRVVSPAGLATRRLVRLR